MKVIDKINGSALFAQSSNSASIATKDNLGRDITATYLTGIDLSNYYTKDETSGAEQLAQAFAAIPGGGGSVSSKYGTISVADNNIEATNKAIEFKSNGFTSAFDSIVLDEYSPPRSITWYDYSQGTTLTFRVMNHGNSDNLTYSSNTNVTGVITAAQWTPTDVNLSIPNATAIQFSADHGYDLQNIQVSASSSIQVKELAWKSDLPTYEYDRNHKVSAINGSALVGNKDYLVEQGFVQNLTSPKGTINVFNNNKIEVTNSAIASDVIEGFVSSYNGVSVYPENSATLTWANYVPNTVLHVSGKQYTPNTLTYSADTGVTGQIAIPDSGENDIEVPTNSTSIVIGNENWGNMNYNFTVSAADYYEIGELAWASAIPTYEYDSTNKISAINGSALAGGSDVPSETVLWSGEGTTACTLSETPSAFDRIRLYGYRDEGQISNSRGCWEFPTTDMTGFDISQYLYNDENTFRALYLTRYALNGLNFSAQKAIHFYATTADTNWSGPGSCAIKIDKIIGINRKV